MEWIGWVALVVIRLLFIRSMFIGRLAVDVFIDIHVMSRLANTRQLIQTDHTGLV